MGWLSGGWRGGWWAFGPPLPVRFSRLSFFGKAFLFLLLGNRLRSRVVVITRALLGLLPTDMYAA